MALRKRAWRREEGQAARRSPLAARRSPLAAALALTSGATVETRTVFDAATRHAPARVWRGAGHERMCQVLGPPTFNCFGAC